MWMSSSAVENVNVPLAMSASIASRPSMMALASPCEMMFCLASMAAWAFDPATSWLASLASKPIEALISCMISAGPPAKRPPHSLLAAGPSVSMGLEE